MKKGDRFIFYGKNKVVKGIVERSFEKVTYDFMNGVKVSTPYIVSEEGEKYNEKMCLKIESDIGLSFLRRVLRLFKKST